MRRYSLDDCPTQSHCSRYSRFVDYFLNTREELFFEVVQSRIRNSQESMRELRTLRRQAMEARSKREKLMGTMTMVNRLHIQVRDAAALQVGYVNPILRCDRGKWLKQALVPKRDVLEPPRPVLTAK